MKLYRYRLVILLFAGILAWVFLFYSHGLVRRLEETNRRANETIAWFWAGTQIPFSEILEERRISVCSGCGAVVNSSTQLDGYRSFCKTCGSVTYWHVVDRWSEEERDRILTQTRTLFQDLVGRLRYTTILSDLEMTPQVINGEPVGDSLSTQELKNWLEVTGKLDQINEPIPLVTVEGDTIGWLHYGVGNLNRELSIVPFVELGMLALLAGVMLLGIRTEIRKEKEMSWIGFAKETAHQLSTPISSLLGWVELLRQKEEGDNDPEMHEAAECMSADLARLNQIVQRYGEMGKKPRLIPSDINEIVSSSVAYFRGRPGLVFPEIGFEVFLEAGRKVMVNPVLFGWVLENLIKNALAALTDTASGVISISTLDLPESGGMVEVRVSDNGRGIPHKDQNKVFQPGFTTRRGGWGLGLTLSRRIVEEYHDGRIRLVASNPGKGSSFSILLPAVEEVGHAG